VIGVTGPVLVLDVGVVAALLIRVANQDRDAGPGRDSVEHAGQDLGSVGLVALGHESALTGTAPAEVERQVLFRERDAGRATVDHHHVARAMALARGGDAEGLSETVTGHLGLLPYHFRRAGVAARASLFRTRPSPVIGSTRA
jgi:hypothetical protein